MSVDSTFLKKKRKMQADAVSRQDSLSQKGALKREPIMQPILSHNDALWHAQRLLVETERAEDLALGTALYRPGEVVWVFRDNDPHEPKQLSDRNSIVWEGQRRAPHPALLISRPLERPPWELVQKNVNDTHLPFDEYDKFSLYLFDSQEIIHKVPIYYITPWLSLDYLLCANPQAFQIVHSWSVFDKIDRLDQPNSSTDAFYNGVFLGAEKIWIGDAVLLQPEVEYGARDIMIIESIHIEKDTNDLLLSGDVFSPNPPSDIKSYVQQRVMPYRIAVHQSGYPTHDPDDIVTVSMSAVFSRWYPPGIIRGLSLRNTEFPKHRVVSRNRVASFTATP